MRLNALAFLAGILALQPLVDLPDRRWAWLLLLLPLLWRKRALRIPALFVGGLLWALWRADLVLSQALPPALEGRDLAVEGVVASLPEQQERGLRFAFQVRSMEHAGHAFPTPGLVRLGWYENAQPVRVGDSWRLTVRLKRPHGFMNPGGFDYEAWLFQQRLRATGYVRGDGDNRLLGSDPWSRPIDRLRQRLAEAIRTALQDSSFAGIIVALATGELHGIDQAQWQVFRDTGTIHLMAISGSHITLVAGLVFFLARRLWAWPGNTVLLWPAPKVAAVAALLAAAGYAALSGFSIPTQRAVVMLGVVMAGSLLNRVAAPSHVLAVALVLVLLLDPLGVLAPGFWLSFATVALILYGMGGRVGLPGPWWKWGRVHWLVALGLLPLTLFLFQRNPWVGPLANLISVPWVELLVVPITLVGSLLLMFSDTVGGAVLSLAEHLMAWLWPLLERLSEWSFAQWAPVGWTLLPAILGVFWLLAPQGVPARWLGAVWLLPLLLLRPAAPDPGEVWFTLLDVGQGLAAVVHTRHHALLYDTGPRFSADFDTGGAVVVPFLRASGIQAVDVLLLSHRGSDHTGGAASVLSQVTVGRVLSGDPEEPVGARVERCHAGQRWTWDNIDFEVLHPPRAGDFDGNNASCVLRVSGPGGAILLPGDIERLAEDRLVREGARLSSSILVAPHHGSNTSSSPGFVQAVSPSCVLFPVGYRNRFGFPIPEVAERYRLLGSRLLDTAQSGAITVKLGRFGLEVDAFRKAARRYWNAP